MILNPMDYEEFKWAQDDTVSYPQLKILFDKKIAIGDAVTRKLMRDFRIYMVVGGMPQAVSEYIDSHNLQEVDRVKDPSFNYTKMISIRLTHLEEFPRFLMPSQLSSTAMPLAIKQQVS